MNYFCYLRSWSKHYRTFYERHGCAISRVKQERTAGHAQRSRGVSPPSWVRSPLLSDPLDTLMLR
jgi:hypothetical protein